MKNLRVMLMGFGAVGRGVADVLQRKDEDLRRMGIRLPLVGVADSKSYAYSPQGLNLGEVIQSKNETGCVGAREVTVNPDILEDLDYDVLVDVTPTNIETGEPGKSYMLTALQNSRHVVTSNKGPLAIMYTKLMETADEYDVELRFEGTVGGAMPVINLARDTLAGNKVLAIEGILNGTCNYILTRMATENLPYEHVLSEAQELGIAETDPTLDVEGIDTACKLVILANSIMGRRATYKDVDVTGITSITPESLRLANEDGYVVKLLGEVRAKTLRVAPRLVPMGHPLAVSGTLNVASLQTDLAGEITITGHGAGSVETASAILSDLVSIAVNGRRKLG